MLTKVAEVRQVLIILDDQAVIFARNTFQSAKAKVIKRQPLKCTSSVIITWADMVNEMHELATNDKHE